MSNICRVSVTKILNRILIPTIQLFGRHPLFCDWSLLFFIEKFSTLTIPFLFLLHRFSSRYELPLLVQSIVMNLTMFLMIHLCVRVKRNNAIMKARDRVFTGMQTIQEQQQPNEQPQPPKSQPKSQPHPMNDLQIESSSTATTLPTSSHVILMPQTSKDIKSSKY